MKRYPINTVVRRVMAGAAEVQIVEMSPVWDEPEAARITVTGGDIAELTRLLAVRDGPGAGCLCAGWPTILVIGAAGEERARWALHHEDQLCGPEGRDAYLKDAPALIAWLADRGLTGPREQQQGLDRDEARREERRVQWVRAAPKLVYLADPVSRREHGAEEKLAALMPRVYPDRVTRIRTLVAWAGFASRWEAAELGDGTPWHELAPQRMLLTEPPEAIVDALLSAPLSPQQLDGAADLVTSLTWAAPVPEPLRAQLIAHVTSTGTEAMKFRMRHGYGDDRTP